MSQQFPTVQALYDLQRDIADLAAIVNGGEAETVTTRYGGDKPTVANVLSGLLDRYKAITSQGDWQSGVTYAPYDVWRSPQGDWYLVVEGYTSTDIATDIASGVVVLHQNAPDIQSDIQALTATVDAAFAFQYPSVQALKDAVASGVRLPGQYATTDSYVAGEGRGANRYLIVDAGSSANRPADDNGSVIHVGTGGLYLKGLFAYGVHIDQFGASIEFGAALANGWRYLKDTGGDLRLPAGSHTSSQQVFPRSSKTVKLLAEGLCIIQPASLPTGPMWHFLKDGSVTYVEFHNIQIDGQITPGDAYSERLAYHGVLVENTNNMRLINCYGRFVDGCAWELRRAHNSIIDLKTFRSGNATDFALLVTGDPDTGAVFNDVTLNGTSERDVKGWCFEAGTLLKSSAELKLHGGPDSLRALQILQVADFELVAKTTYQFNDSGFVWIGDVSNTAGVGLYQSVANANQVCRGVLSLSNHFNNRFMLTSGSADLITVDCSTSNSAIQIRGLMKSIATEGGDVRVLGLDGGQGNVYLDLSQLLFAGTHDSLSVDDRRIKQKTLIPGLPGKFVGAIDNFGPPSRQDKTVGEIRGYVTPGEAGVVPPMAFTSFCGATDTYGRVIERHHKTVDVGTVSADGQLLLPASFLLCAVDTQGAQAPSYITRLQISCTDLLYTYSATDHWEFDLYKNFDVLHSFLLTREHPQGTGLLEPDRSMGDNVVGQVMDYWTGLDAQILKGQFIALRARSVGAPAPLNHVALTVHYEMRI